MSHFFKKNLLKYSGGKYASRCPIGAQKKKKRFIFILLKTQQKTWTSLSMAVKKKKKKIQFASLRNPALTRGLQKVTLYSTGKCTAYAAHASLPCLCSVPAHIHNKNTRRKFLTRDAKKLVAKKLVLKHLSTF